MDQMFAEWKIDCFNISPYEAYLLPGSILPYFLMTWWSIKQRDNDRFHLSSNLPSHEFGIFHKMGSYPHQRTL
jgi:hypothetical protein